MSSGAGAGAAVVDGERAPREGRAQADRPRTPETAEDVRAACAAVVDQLHERWELPSAYLLVDGRLRCQASRGYFQVSDGFTVTTGVIGRVVSTGTAVVVQDVSADPAFVAAVPGLQSEACLPVRVFGEVVGALNLESRDSLPDEAVRELELAAGVLGRRLEALGGLPPSSVAQRAARIGVELAGQTAPAQVRRCALQGAQDLSGASTAALAQRTEDGWVLTEAVGPLEPLLRRWDGVVLARLAGWVDAKTSSYFPPGEEVPAGYDFLDGDIHALSVQPLVAAGQVTGLLITADAEPAAHDPALTAAMELLATQTAAMTAVTSTLEELARQAGCDPLTGLLNRRGLLEHIERAASEDEGVLVLLDLDGFKAVNDRYGHARGDELLTAVARGLTSATPDRGLVFRLGGDEFAVLIPGLSSRAAAVDLGTALVQAATLCQVEVELTGVGASAGLRLLDTAAARTALADADDALYAAKRRGGRQAVVWTSAAA